MRNLIASLVPLVWASALAGQSLERRIADAPDGEVRLTFTARPGVIGDGEGMISWDCDGERCHHSVSRGNRRRGRLTCEEGPVRVRLTVRDRAVVDVDTYVGGDWRETTTRVTDLGTVAAPEAARWLLTFARRDRGRAGQQAILPALLADSVTTWPTLLEIARDGAVPQRTRNSAVFWVGQAAEEAATQGLAELVDREGERGVQEAAVFALSQRPRDEGVPILLQVARTHRDPEVRRKAIFWLAQSGDPRALAFFEELLTRS